MDVDPNRRGATRPDPAPAGAEHEALLRTIVERVPASVAIFDDRMRYLMASRRFLDDFGLDPALRPEDLVGRSHYDVFPGFPEAYRRIHERVLAGETASNDRDASPLLDGGLGWARWEMRPWRRADGSIGGAIFLAEVTTERVRQQEALDERERRLQLALRSPRVGAFDWDVPRGTIEFSESAQRIYGLPAGEQPVASSFALVLDEDRAEVDAAVAAGLDPSGDGGFTVQHRMRRPDGTVGCVEVLGQVSFETSADGVRRPTTVAGIVRDLSTEYEAARERDRLAAEVDAQRRRLDAVLSNASVAIFVMDERQHCTYMNPAAETLTGWTLAETQGRPLHDVVHHSHPDGRPFPIEDCAIDRAFPGRMQVQGEETFVHRDGRFYPVAFTASPIRDEDGRPVGTIVEVRDIRREKEVLESLRDADRRKDEFLAMLAHELRNPLAPITMSVQVLQRAGELTPAARQCVAMIGRQAQRMKRLVDDLLDVSRITRGRIALRREPCNLGVLVLETADALAAGAAAKRQRLLTRLPPEPVRLELDPVRIGQVLENLLGNAIKYTPEGGRIEVALEPSDDAVEIVVRDDGIGVDPATLESVFELFVQGEPGAGAQQDGLGIGLALAKGLVGLHGGTLRAESAGRGQGATFTVRLPRDVPG